MDYNGLFFSLKTKDADTVQKILSRQSNIEFGGINVLESSLTVGQIVFIVLGGDKPAWETGLTGIGILSKAPYDNGYEKRNFKIQVDIRILLAHPIKREDLIPYRDTYGIIGIAPIVKWEPNQALSQVDRDKALALMRAMLEISPDIKDDLQNLVGASNMSEIEGTTTKMVEVPVNYNENITDALDRFIQEKKSRTDVSVTSNLDDEYQRAAKTITDHINEVGLEFDEKTKGDAEDVRNRLLERFSPEKLKALPDDKLLQTMFYSADSDNDSLSYFLEFDANCKQLYGSISGGSAYKFILFQRKEDGVWTTGTPIHPEKLTEEQALVLGKSIRDYLVRGAEIIEKAELNTPEDYDALDKKLNEETDGKCTFAWVHKYYTMLFPDKLTPFHSFDWQRHILYALRIRPSQTYYGRDGQISLVRRLCGLDYISFGTAFGDKFGEIKKFIRLGTTDNNGNHYAEELRRDSAVGIGWNAVGPLSDYLTGNKINRKALAEALKGEYYTEPSKNNVASRKAGEMATFYEATDNSVFVAMDGERVLAFVDGIGDNYFEENTELGHRRSGIWHLSFNDNETLPNPSEGHLTSCYELGKEENLMFLYEKYYYGEEEGDEKMNLNKAYQEPVYHTGLKTAYPLNRIVFGAPGTGKSFRLEEERKTILRENPDNPKQHIGDYERVTFHPDYTYSQFVGTYKPVSEGRDIYYKFVPGPFMRVYVKAIKNGIETAESGNPEPFVLLIEEINRAPVSAVFGDVFQLLDRDDNGISQYEIEASEDIRRYLADELGGDPNDYQKIKIPDNMFIWASMNSADQGVFPMDTAFKRRWDFTYIGVNDNEDKIKGKYVIIGSAKRQRVEWNSLRRAINNFLARNKINEDKQLGPFFLSKNIVAPEGSEIDSEKFNDAFTNKVIMYLFEDAARQRRPQLFKGCFENSSRYSEICREFRDKGIGILMKKSTLSLIRRTFRTEI